jgi:hypothetical protein
MLSPSIRALRGPESLQPLLSRAPYTVSLLLDCCSRYDGAIPGHALRLWSRFLPLYQRHFGLWWNSSEHVSILEVGLGGRGGTIDLWKAVFGKDLRYYGVDTDPGIKRCRRGQGLCA